MRDLLLGILSRAPLSLATPLSMQQSESAFTRVLEPAQRPLRSFPLPSPSLPSLFLLSLFRSLARERRAFSYSARADFLISAAINVDRR